jgi:hypothetical protein
VCSRSGIGSHDGFRPRTYRTCRLAGGFPCLVSSPQNRPSFPDSLVSGSSTLPWTLVRP